MNSEDNGGGVKVKMSTIQVAGLPLNTQDSSLEDVFSNFGPIKRCFVVRPKLAGAKKTIGIVQFAFSDDAAKLYKEKGGAIEIGNDEYKIKLLPDRANTSKKSEVKDEPEELPREDQPPKKTFKQIQDDIIFAKKKRARLIVRNLSFKADETSLKEHFEQCGNVEDVNILKKKDGKMVGCAFIQFSNVSQAANAIKQLNGKPLLQRPIAVDWAVPKKEYEDQNKTASSTSKQDEEVEVKEETTEPDDEMEEEATPIKDEDDEEEDEDEDELDEDDDDDEGEGSKRKFGQEVPKKKWTAGHDVSENKTVFIRNLNFDSDQDDLRALMDQYFGKVIFAVMVIDKMTERPKGTAFVKFASEESAVKCVETSETEGIFLDGRQIYCKMALAKADAEEMEKAKKLKEPKDSRNLFLAREGLVREGTLAAQGVSKADLEKRVQLEKYKRTVLKNLNMFVSPTRICFRNIPPQIDDKKLLAIVKKFSENPTAKITECRIMKDLKNGGISKGFAFITFDKHEDALNALRKMNNNPKVFTRDARPIIDFSIENRTAIVARQKRELKSIEKNPLAKKSDVPAKTADNTSHSLPKQVKRKIDEVNGEDLEGEAEGSEKKKFVGSISDPAVKKLPSHLGPKVRHNPKISRKVLAKQDKAKRNPKKSRKNKNVDQQVTSTANTIAVPTSNGKQKAGVAPPKSEKKLKRIRREQVEEKKFNSLVASYKSRLMSSANIQQKTKWCD